MDTGNFKATVGGVSVESKAKGIWGAGVARYMATPNVELLGRVGYDFGDDDGLLFGIGAGYIVNKNLKLRLEFVEREDVSSIQFNVVFYPW
jgi:hypothetical protein